MPRKSRTYKRHKVDADPKYNNVKIAKFINYMMERGKKSVAQGLVYDAFDNIHKKLELRITIVGDKVFAASIDSQSSELAKNDWRKQGFIQLFESRNKYWQQ